MAFEKFVHNNKSFAPKASLNPRGYLSFNDGARRKFKLDKSAFAMLHYDRDVKLIGIELTDDGEEEGAVKLRHRPTGATIGAKSFMGYYEIEIAKTTVFDVTQNSDGLLVMDLNNGRERNSSDDVSDESDENDEDELA